MPVWALLLLISILFLLCNWFFTTFQEPPAKGLYLVVLVLVGFAGSVLWISAIAQELVSLLNAIGLMLHISPVILGLTILAWGNSLGDMVSDISLARQGYPQMSMGGVYACIDMLYSSQLAPTFNMTIGMGVSLLITCIKTFVKGGEVISRGTTDLGPDTSSINLTFIFLIITLISTVIVGDEIKDDI